MRAITSRLPCLIILLAARPEAAASADAGLQERIQGAIEKGQRELLRRLDVLLRSPPSDFPVGRIAFPVAALLKSGVSPDEPAVKAAFERLAGLKVEKTYCAACYLFALDAAWRARGKGGDDSKTKITEVATWLAAQRNRGHGSWTYGVPSRQEKHDFSNTQFAVLGLEIALQHGVAVPREVLLDVAKLFSSSIVLEGGPAEFEVTVEAPLEVKLGLTRVSPTRRKSAAPGGWGYTDRRRGKGPNDDPYPSMTAAGASSLIIALHALEDAKHGGKDDVRIAADAARGLESAYAWIAKSFDRYLADEKEVFYTLYSLEKVGDLGGIEKFGSRDWYGEGAERLLSLQHSNGGWGTYVNTAFALLFLTRATRLFEAVASPAIVTGGSGEKPAGGAVDLVYVDRAKGFLSAREILKYIGETRRAEMLPIGDEVLRGYAPDAREDLAAPLLLLWSKPDRVTDWARKALADVTGLRSPDRKAYEAWTEDLARVRRLEAAEKLQAAEVSAEIEHVSGVRLKARLAGLAFRRDMRSLTGLLVKELSVASLEYRRTLHGILRIWTSAPVEPPPKDTDAGWEATARAWQDWWLLHK